MYGYTTGQRSGHLQNEVEMVTTTRLIFFQRSDYNHPVWQKWNAKVKQMNVVMDNGVVREYPTKYSFQEKLDP